MFVGIAIGISIMSMLWGASDWFRRRHIVDVFQFWCGLVCFLALVSGQIADRLS